MCLCLQNALRIGILCTVRRWGSGVRENAHHMLICLIVPVGSLIADSGLGEILSPRWVELSKCYLGKYSCH